MNNARTHTNESDGSSHVVTVTWEPSGNQWCIVTGSKTTNGFDTAIAAFDHVEHTLGTVQWIETRPTVYTTNVVTVAENWVDGQCAKCQQRALIADNPTESHIAHLNNLCYPCTVEQPELATSDALTLL